MSPQHTHALYKAGAGKCVTFVFGDWRLSVGAPAGTDRSPDDATGQSSTRFWGQRPSPVKRPLIYFFFYTDKYQKPNLKVFFVHAHNDQI